MATYYSEHFQPTERGAVTSASSPPHRASAGVSHSRLRYKKASFAFTPATGDLLHICKLKTSDRIFSLSVANNALGTTVPVDVGFYDSAGTTVVDADAIADDLVIATGSNRNQLTDAIGVGSGSVYNLTGARFIGSPIWAARGLSADPDTQYTVVATIGTVSSGTSGQLVFTVGYVAGD